MKAYYKGNPDKILLVLENIDHYLNVEQYFSLMRQLEIMTLELDINIIVTTSIRGFVYINEKTLRELMLLTMRFFYAYDRGITKFLKIIILATII